VPRIPQSGGIFPERASKKVKKIFENPAGSLPEAARGGKRLFRPETAPRVFVQ